MIRGVSPSPFPDGIPPNKAHWTNNTQYVSIPTVYLNRLHPKGGMCKCENFLHLPPLHFPTPSLLPLLHPSPSSTPPPPPPLFPCSLPLLIGRWSFYRSVACSRSRIFSHSSPTLSPSTTSRWQTRCHHHLYTLKVFCWATWHISHTHTHTNKHRMPSAHLSQSTMPTLMTSKLRCREPRTVRRTSGQTFRTSETSESPPEGMSASCQCFHHSPLLAKI